jgi:hypothetical protein
MRERHANYCHGIVLLKRSAFITASHLKQTPSESLHFLYFHFDTHTTIVHLSLLYNLDEDITNRLQAISFVGSIRNVHVILSWLNHTALTANYQKSNMYRIKVYKT